MLGDPRAGKLRDVEKHRHLHTRGELEARLRVLLGGDAAERTALGDISTGAEHDLREATRLASRMVAHEGMSDLGPFDVEHQEEDALLGQRIASDGAASDGTVYAIELEARGLLGAALARACSDLDDHRPAFDRRVAALLAYETLERENARPARPARRRPRCPSDRRADPAEHGRGKLVAHGAGVCAVVTRARRALALQSPGSCSVRS